MTDTLLRSSLPRLTDRYSLGSSALRVSPICLGIVHDPRVVSEAFDRGIIFFFLSADLHWPLYEGTRRGLADLFRRGGQIRDQVVVAAVSYAGQPNFGAHAFGEVVDNVTSLERIDLTVVGGVGGPEDARFASFAVDRAEGAVPGVAASGATFHWRPDAAVRLSRGEIDIAYVRYNAGHPGAEREVFPFLPEPRRSLVYGFKSTFGFVPEPAVRSFGITGDVWIPSLPDHYRFALTRPELDGLLVAPHTLSELGCLEAALARGPLGRDEVGYMKTLAAVRAGRARLKESAPSRV